jgi:hypothetical protein
MEKKNEITVLGVPIRVFQKENDDFISLTDMVKGFGDDSIIYSWMRNRNTLEFIGIWEELHNDGFKGDEFVTFKKQAGLNSFNLTPRKWIEATNAIGIASKAGRYGGGTFAHKDIAFEFGSWLSPQFELYLIKEFQRLKENESRQDKLEWNFQRTLAKVNYQIHTDAIKENLIPPELNKLQINRIYAEEADLLNVALFGCTAKEWREKNPAAIGNIRDSARLEQLVVLSNLESINSVLIQQKISSSERVVKLNGIAISQMKILVNNRQLKKLK